MSTKVIDTLILDLDNTLFDWFAVWYASFQPIYLQILRVAGRAEIQADIRKVHQARRTSEYTFLIEEIEALKDIRKSGDVRACFHEALEESRRKRDQNLKLYPGVFRSLWRKKGQGTRIIGYTESMAFYSAYRLKRFGLDGVIDMLFSPQDHDTPAGVSIDRLRRLPDEFYELQVTEKRHTPPGELKPNPRVLLDIIRVVGSKIFKRELCALVIRFALFLCRTTNSEVRLDLFHILGFVMIGILFLTLLIAQPRRASDVAVPPAIGTTNQPPTHPTSPAH